MDKEKNKQQELESYRSAKERMKSGGGELVLIQRESTVGKTDTTSATGSR